MARPPNFKQEKKRREEAQKKRNQAKQQERAARRGGVATLAELNGSPQQTSALAPGGDDER